jgi:cellulose synthase/poly-beta-1,6-N-acetylglucosamine synthase-like glycosyltransferase
MGSLISLRRWPRDAAFARSQGQRRLEEPVLKASPRVSTLVGAWNPQEDLAAFIAGFRSVQYANKELILAVGGAHRIEEVQSLAGDGVILVENPGGGKNAALERCLEKATGDILHVTDADCLLNSEAYLRLLAPIINGEELVTTGASEPHRQQQDNLWVQLQWAGRGLDFARSSPYRNRLRGKSYALTRAALAAAGGIVVDVLGEDYYLGNRLVQEGYRIRFVPDSVIETYFFTDLPGYMRQRARWLRAVVLDGLRLGRYGDVFLTLRGSFLALSMLLLTASLPFTRQRGALLLLLPLLRSYLLHARQLTLAGRLGLFRVGPRHYLAALAQIYVDLLTSARTLLEYPFAGKRYRW